MTYTPVNATHVHMDPPLAVSCTDPLFPATHTDPLFTATDIVLYFTATLTDTSFTAAHTDTSFTTTPTDFEQYHGFYTYDDPMTNIHEQLGKLERSWELSRLKSYAG